MDYEYDAFFSYKRDAQSDLWHCAVKGKLEYWLKHELNRTDVRLFLDTEEIRSGVRWRSKLADALRRSKAIICVWSPLYFQSPWCVSEWKTFAARESRYNMELVVPASYHDGECFPQEAKAKQILDLSRYTSTAPRFWDTEIAVEFERECIKPFARDVAALIRQAPAFDPNFPLVEVAERDLPSPPPITRIANA